MAQLVAVLNKKNKFNSLYFNNGKLFSSVHVANAMSYSITPSSTAGDILSVIPETSFNNTWNTLVVAEQPIQLCDFSSHLENMATTVANMIVSQLTGSMSALTFPLGASSLSPTTFTIRGGTT